MSIKKVAIIGRPNVGKSFLFNRLSKTISAIVDAVEGVTRDNKSHIVIWNEKMFELVDTGGLFGKHDFDQQILEKAGAVIAAADLVLLVVDAQVGLLPVERKIAKLLQGKKTLLVANKCDFEQDEAQNFDFLALGLAEPYAVSAKLNRGTRILLDKVAQMVGEPVDARQEKEKLRSRIRFSIVGRPNVGKSSLLNKIFGQELSIVSPISGTTRDSIGSNITYKGREIHFVDTAGLRRKSRIKYGVEYFSSQKAIATIISSDVVILVLDATEKFSNQDQKIGAFAKNHYKNILVVVNKWDLVKKDNKSHDDYKRRAFKFFRFLDDCPIIFTSALTGQRVDKILQGGIDLYDRSSKRVSTAKLNIALQSWLQRFPPSRSSGKLVKVFFATQVQTNPIKVVVVCSNPDNLGAAYKGYLLNCFKRDFELGGVSVKMIYKQRGKNDKLDNQ